MAASAEEEKEEKEMRLYLAGAIENTRDGGATWRQLITPKIEAIGCDVFDPVVHTDGGMVAGEMGHDKFSWPAWSNLRGLDPAEYYRIGKMIRKEDLIQVARSDALIVRMDKATCNSDGTCGEMTLASFLNIPIYVFWDEGVNHFQVPAWKMWCNCEFYENESKLLEKLVKLLNR